MSDEYLEQIYGASACLIAASVGEGFGLPLIEAAQHGLPILSRDLPVFREVAGAHATYFSGETAFSLTVAVRGWLSALECGRVVGSEGMEWLSWRESARALLQALDIAPGTDDGLEAWALHRLEPATS